MKRVLLLLFGFALATSAAAQVPPTPPPGTTNVEVDPIRCWWRTSAGAVRTGETFELSLTCAMLETEAVQVVPDESRLGAPVIQMAPFEVLSGSHPADLHSERRRFFQYLYTLRIISPDAIGKDVRIPDIVIHYRINSRVSGDAALQGRDLVYVLPPQSVRITSMVPADAVDIRDQQGQRFADAETLSFRAGVLEIVALTCVALGGLMIILMLVGLARRNTRRTPSDERQLSPSTILGAALSELASVQRSREQQGWDETLVGRALAATRVVAATALGRPVSQKVTSGGTAGEGRLLIRSKFRGKPRLVSSPTTAADVARAQTMGTSPPVVEDALDNLRDALAGLAGAQYGRDGLGDEATLDAALNSAVAAGGRVKRRHHWLSECVRRFRGAPVAGESRA